MAAAAAVAAWHRIYQRQHGIGGGSARRNGMAYRACMAASMALAWRRSGISEIVAALKHHQHQSWQAA